MFLVVFGVIILLAGLKISFWLTPGEDDFIETRVTAISGGKSASPALLDSDNDGLKDWEETVYGTDPNKPDTDGDGTKDGDEIAQKRNPKKPGPEDTADASMVFLGQGGSLDLLREVVAGGNLTQILFGQVAQKEGVQSFLQKDGAERVSSEFLAYIEEFKKGASIKFSADAVSDSEVRVSSDSSNSAVKTYFNSVAAIYEKNLAPLKGDMDDTEIMTRALQTKDSALLEKIGLLFTAAGGIGKELLLLPAPQVVLVFHKKEIWFMRKTVEQLSLLKDVSLDDPLLILLLVSLRTELKKEVTAFHRNEIPQWLREKNIVFLPGDKAPLLYPQL